MERAAIGRCDEMGEGTKAEALHTIPAQMQIVCVVLSSCSISRIN